MVLFIKGVGDFQPKVKPYPINSLRNFKLDKVKCGGNFTIVTLEKCYF